MIIQSTSSHLPPAKIVSVPDATSTADPWRLFTPLEVVVLRLAQTESATRAREHGFLRRWIGRILSLPPANRLANEQLEALRRFAVVAWSRGETAVAKLLPNLLACGYTQRQASAVISIRRI